MRTLTVLAVVVAVAVAFIAPLQTNVLECEMCEVAVKVVAPTIGKDMQGVENIFITECEKVIPGKIGQRECKQYGDKELGNIIKELESGTAPKDVCTKLHTC